LCSNCCLLIGKLLGLPVTAYRREEEELFRWMLGFAGRKTWDCPCILFLTYP
jgi:hypothetical protein